MSFLLHVPRNIISSNHFLRPYTYVNSSKVSGQNRLVYSNRPVVSAKEWASLSIPQRILQYAPPNLRHEDHPALLAESNACQADGRDMLQTIEEIPTHLKGQTHAVHVDEDAAPVGRQEPADPREGELN